MRVTQHSGRVGIARHNDRNFDMTKADHIDPDRSSQNRYWCCEKGVGFEEAELHFYEQHYGAAIEATNARYRAAGHPERCRTVKQVLEAPKTRPEEVILQVGKAGATVDRKTLAGCVNTYMRHMEQWSKDHGGCLHLLSMALHMDEATPHVHIRRVWGYTDPETGLERIGQGRALKEAGIELPEPQKPQGRFNNRKMTFDREMRDFWQRVCKSHGLEIETEPASGKRHLATVEYKVQEAERQLVNITDERDAARREVQQLRKQAIRQQEQLQQLPDFLRKGLRSQQARKDLDLER